MSFQLAGGEPVKLLFDKYKNFSLAMLAPHSVESVPPRVGFAVIYKVSKVDMLPHAPGRDPVNLVPWM